MSQINHFKYYKTGPEIIKLAVMYYVRFPLSLRQVEDILHERYIAIKEYHTMIKIALTIILTLFPSISMACDCASRPIEERYNESEAVFLGDVVAHESNPNHWNGSDVIQFKVIESFKGNFGNMAVKTGQSMCDYFFPDIGKPGEHFLVFLTITKEGISINRCFGTSLESSATEDLKWLRLHSKKIKNHNKKK